MDPKEFLQRCSSDSFVLKLAASYKGEVGAWPIERIKSLIDIDDTVHKGQVRITWFLGVAFVLGIVLLLVFIGGVLLHVAGKIEHFSRFAGWVFGIGGILLPIFMWELMLAPRVKYWRGLVSNRREEFHKFNRFLHDLFDLLALGSRQQRKMLIDSDVTTYQSRVRLMEYAETLHKTERDAYAMFVQQCRASQVSYAFERLKLEHMAQVDKTSARLLAQANSKHGIPPSSCDHKLRLTRLSYLAELFLVPALSVEQAFKNGKDWFNNHFAQIGDYSI